MIDLRRNWGYERDTGKDKTGVGGRNGKWGRDVIIF